MQHTLLGLAIACILALLAALIGPRVVDWNTHRAFFEQEASRLVGLKVRVDGPIRVSLLPVPSVTLGGIEIGPDGESARLRARSLGIELGLAPLLRGEFRAVEMNLGGPEFSIGLNSLGQVDWPAMQFVTETLSIDRLKIDEGRVVVADARSGSRMVLDKLWFTGEVRSLTGPVRGNGAFASAGKIYGYRVAAGRFGPDGMRLRVSVDDAEWPLNAELEGTLSFDRASPRFDGTLALARPAGSVQPSGKTMVNEPWRLTSKVRASNLSAVLEQVTFQYGAEERAAKLSGDAVLHFGEQTRLEGALSARQVDIDRLIATPDAPRRLPLAAIQTFAETFGSALRPGLPVSLAISVDALTIGGATLQAIGSDLRSDGKAWHLDKLEFRAPGFAQARLSGQLDPSAKALGFSGEARLDASDPRALIAWLAGQPASAGPLKPWQLRGHLTLGAERIAVERLRAEFDRGAIEGRLAYLLSGPDRPARLAAELSAAELDVDALLSFADGALSGATLEPPREVELAVEVGKARIAGFEARATTARLKFDTKGIAIERLSVADFGNAKVEASGRIDTTSTPGGKIAIDVDARELDGLVALADKFAQPLAGSLRLLAGRNNSGKMRATVSLEKAEAGAAGKLMLTGRVGAVRVTMNAAATGKPEAFVVTDLRALERADVRIDGKLEADDSAILLALAGLDRVALGDQRPGSLSFNAVGPLSGELQIETRLLAGPIDIGAKGKLQSEAGRPAEFDFEHLAGTISGSKVQGRLAVALSKPLRVEGMVDVDALDAPALVASAIGMPAGRARKEETAGWSSEPFTRSAWGVVGRIELKAQRAALYSGLAAHQLRGVIRLGESQIVLDELGGDLGNGRLEGRLAVSASADGLMAHTRLAVTGADAGAIVVTDGRAPITGRLDFQTELEGAGLSPAAFVGSLSGNGRITIDDVHLAGLNPRVFDAVIRAVDLGIPTDPDRIRDFVTSALDTASLSARRIEVPIAVSAGRARLGPFSAQAHGADLDVSASISLADATLDSQITLAGMPIASGAVRPMIFMTLRGPISAAKRTLDANALATWLALRAVEQQAKRLDAMEGGRREASAQPPAEPARESPAAREDISSKPPVPSASNDASAVPSAAAVGQAPPLPPSVNVLPTPRPRPAPRAQGASQPARQAVPRNPALPSLTGRPLDLLGSQY